MDNVKEIYDNLNLKYNCKEIFIIDFTAEQIFYQAEDLVNKVIEKNESKIDRYYISCEKEINKSNNTEGMGNEMQTREAENYKCIEETKNSSDKESDVEFEDEEISNQDDSCEDQDEKSNDCETSSEFSFDKESDEVESEELTIDDLKDLPACDIFKYLDKNIKK